MGDRRRRVVETVIGRATVLPSSLLVRWPELADARWRRGGLPVYVAGWCLGRRAVAAITLWRVVFLAHDAPLDPELLLHELRHVRQFASSRTFPFRYLWASARHGYFENPYEADARVWAARRLREPVGAI